MAFLFGKKKPLVPQVNQQAVNQDTKIQPNPPQKPILRESELTVIEPHEYSRSINNEIEEKIQEDENEQKNENEESQEYQEQEYEEEFVTDNQENESEELYESTQQNNLKNSGDMLEDQLIQLKKRELELKKEIILKKQREREELELKKEMQKQPNVSKISDIKINSDIEQKVIHVPVYMTEAEFLRHMMNRIEELIERQEVMEQWGRNLTSYLRTKEK